jgi:hypothetical protein
MQGKIQRVITRQFPVSKVFRQDSPFETHLEFDFYEDFDEDVRIVGISTAVAVAVGEPSLIVTVVVEGTPKPAPTSRKSL